MAAAKNNTELSKKLSAKTETNGNGKPLTVAEQVRHYLSRPDVMNEIRTALPKHVTAERLARISLTTIRTTPALLECSLPSLVGAIMQAAQLGLEPGLLGHCYFVPLHRKIKTPGEPDRWVKEVQFIIGYKGLLDLARRAGGIVTIAAEAIYSNDTFLYRKGFEEVLSHEPNFEDRGELIGFYAYATTKDGGRYATVMTKGEVDKIRARSKAKDNGPWVTDYEEMGKKTALRRLTKYLPLSIEVVERIRVDEQREFGDDVSAIELNLGDKNEPLLSAPTEAIDVTPSELTDDEAAELNAMDFGAQSGTAPLPDTTSDVYSEHE